MEGGIPLALGNSHPEHQSVSFEVSRMMMMVVRSVGASTSPARISAHGASWTLVDQADGPANTDTLNRTMMVDHPSAAVNLLYSRPLRWLPHRPFTRAGLFQRSHPLPPAASLAWPCHADSPPLTPTLPQPPAQIPPPLLPPRPRPQRRARTAPAVAPASTPPSPPPIPPPTPFPTPSPAAETARDIATRPEDFSVWGRAGYRVQDVVTQRTQPAIAYAAAGPRRAFFAVRFDQSMGEQHPNRRLPRRPSLYPTSRIRRFSAATPKPDPALHDEEPRPSAEQGLVRLLDRHPASQEPGHDDPPELPQRVHLNSICPTPAAHERLRPAPDAVAAAAATTAPAAATIVTPSAPCTVRQREVTIGDLDQRGRGVGVYVMLDIYEVRSLH
ncbi:hypothetical protein BDK51DRAFT_52606 [Blyttiomyces helicus]|uniref:Uncharacterized protein n=1 Tax=Blyttiomyces helicus TaxID=388810 RepID=A0A4P9WCR3_9FUNG|nr:hypothetical protein BDK51DRAFT_52606 [Blyttiomyces helicus]|eukprot:RKO89455.1 hypothetical protein BDK51DRAFT_52606 [Blyttiomyces helicus]